MRVLQTSRAHKYKPSSMFCILKVTSGGCVAVKIEQFIWWAVLILQTKISGLPFPFLVPIPFPASEGVRVRSSGWYVQRRTGWCGPPLHHRSPCL